MMYSCSEWDVVLSLRALGTLNSPSCEKMAIEDGSSDASIWLDGVAG